MKLLEKLFSNETMCRWFGHDEEQIEDFKIEGDVVVVDGIKANEFTFPAVVHQYKCKRCGYIRQDKNPDMPGSMGGRYVVHYI